MHELIDAGIVETIRTTGKTNANLPDRLEILKTHGLPYDREAENVVVTGCQILPLLPHIIASLARVLDRGGVSYTFLSEETCCGNYLYRPAIKARNDEAMEECRSLSREFVGQNVERARMLGAKRLVIFCSPCYPIYKHAFPDEEIVFYPGAIREAMGRARLEGRADYYAGCYRLHRKFSPVPMDLKSADQVLDNIESLEVNRISAPKCCFTPEGLSHMVDNVGTDLMVHICTGCYGQALQGLAKEKGTEVLMLPELVERAML